jgi:hypothetical protein
MTELLRKLDDPELDNIKINSQDHFELVYMRHRYFRKSTNPSPQRLAKFEDMICNISNKIYLRNIEIFKTAGFEMEDLRNVGRVHTVSFISMGGLQENPELMEKFRELHKKRYGQNSEPKERDIFLKECYNLSKFLNQRLQEVAKFCKVKNGNIRGTKSHKKFYIGDPGRNPSDIDLFYNPDNYGYKNITEVEYKKQVKESKTKNKTQFLNNNNQMVRAVYIKGSLLTDDDVSGTELDPRKNSFYRSPEDNLILKEYIYETENKNLYK